MYSFFAEESRFANIGLQKRDIAFYKTTDSTNTRAREAFLASQEDAPRLYVAEEQTAGRGTRGRSFESKKGGLYFSLLYRPESKDADVTGITAIAAAAVFDALFSLLGGDFHARIFIKWVNDVYIEDKKISGILCEKINNGTDTAYVIGIGINVLSADLSPDVSKIASSIEEMTGISLDRETLLYEILARLIPATFSPCESPLAEIYRQHMLPCGTRITVTDASGNARDAAVMGLGEDFSLLVRYENGESESLISGDVRIKL